MIPATSPEELLCVVSSVIKQGAEGILLSGGSNSRGMVELDRFAPAIKEIKRMGLKVNVHTGLIRSDTIPLLAEAAPDCFSVDVVGDERVIKNIFHIEASPADYLNSIRLLFDNGVKKVVPHYCVGLSDDSDKECEVIDLLSGLPISAFVVIIFRPTPGTPLFNRRPPDDSRVLNFVGRAVESLHCPVLIGCMRPRGNWELEIECAKLGVTGIALPSRRTVTSLREEGYRVETQKCCCALYR
jgi:uncharacterized radical SAM superfamily protein